MLSEDQFWFFCVCFFLLLLLFCHLCYLKTGLQGTSVKSGTSVRRLFHRQEINGNLDLASDNQCGK